MILKNFINIGLGYLTNKHPVATSGSDSNYQHYFMKLISRPFQAYTNDTTSNITNSGISQIGICLSSDTTPPALDDYKLNTFLTGSDLTPVSNSVVATDNNYVLIQTVKNDTAENKVINTVGVFCGTNDLMTNLRFLITKTLLGTPITIAPEEIKTITVNINLDSFTENINA